MADKPSLWIEYRCGTCMVTLTVDWDNERLWCRKCGWWWRQSDSDGADAHGYDPDASRWRVST